MPALRMLMRGKKTPRRKDGVFECSIRMMAAANEEADYFGVSIIGLKFTTTLSPIANCLSLMFLETR